MPNGHNDTLPTFRKGDAIKAQPFNDICTVVRRQQAQPGSFVTGAHTTQRRVGTAAAEATAGISGAFAVAAANVPAAEQLDYGDLPGGLGGASGIDDGVACWKLGRSSDDDPTILYQLAQDGDDIYVIPVPDDDGNPTTITIQNGAPRAVKNGKLLQCKKFTGLDQDVYVIDVEPC